MDRRPEELRHIGILVDFLCDEYPELFKKEDYTHPVEGVCKSLILKTLGVPAIDYKRINRINLDYHNNWVQIEVNTPLIVHNIRPLFKDGSVF